MAAKLLMLWRPLWTHHFISSAVRIPLITFPTRRGTDGRPLVIISLDHFNKSKSQNINDINTDTHIVTIPINYGRTDISEEEINIINTGGAG